LIESNEETNPMDPATSTPPVPDIIYPDSDGLPMGDNTKQIQWIVLLYWNLKAQFRDRGDVFVASNLLWYPAENHPEIRIGPDVLVAFGRPKGNRGSYKQWEEGHAPPTVVFEILSPGNSDTEMKEKQAFYEEHGVEEYYVYDPDTNHLKVFVRRGEVFRRIRRVNGFVSPRLEIRFDLSGPELVVRHPDGRPFVSPEESEDNRVRAEREAERSRQEAERSRQEADRSQQRSARMAELGRKVRRGQATAEELRELEELEDQSLPPPA
jgi:Uma2 family endonuclease